MDELLKLKRKKLIDMILNVSILKDGVCNIKKNVPDNLIITHKNIKYYPTAYSLRARDGKIFHRAELHELNSNSVTGCYLEELDI